jgi:hypothetical protein
VTILLCKTNLEYEWNSIFVLFFNFADKIVNLTMGKFPLSEIEERSAVLEKR